MDIESRKGRGKKKREKGFCGLLAKDERVWPICACLLSRGSLRSAYWWCGRSCTISRPMGIDRGSHNEDKAGCTRSLKVGNLPRTGGDKSLISRYMSRAAASKYFLKLNVFGTAGLRRREVRNYQLVRKIVQRWSWHWISYATFGAMVVPRAHTLSSTSLLFFISLNRFVPSSPASPSRAFSVLFILDSKA